MIYQKKIELIRSKNNNAIIKQNFELFSNKGLNDLIKSMGSLNINTVGQIGFK